MASIRQLGLDGELRLTQNDGQRNAFWNKGQLIYLQSEVAGEQFGNYLLRQGILDFPALSELLANDEQYRLGEKVIQWGMMSVQERDCHLLSLQEQIMIHALEHEVVELSWQSGNMTARLSEDLHFKLNHRAFIWNTFQEAHNQTAICDLMFLETGWKWEGRTHLLDTVEDLPLTPTTAYALSFLGTEPISFETFLSLSRLPEQEAATLLITLWTLGELTLTQGQLPFTLPTAAEPEPTPAPPPPTPATPLSFPIEPATAGNTPGEPLPPIELEHLPLLEGPEFMDAGADPILLAAPPAPAEYQPEPMDAQVKARKLVIKAKQLLAQDRTVEAIRALEQSVQLDPEAENAYEAWLILGRLRMSNPAWSTRSIDALQTASRLRPKAAEPWAHMGDVYFRKGFKANAIACFNRALELDPSVPIAPDIDLREEVGAGGTQPHGSIFKRFKSMLGRGETK